MSELDLLLEHAQDLVRLGRTVVLPAVAREPWQGAGRSGVVGTHSVTALRGMDAVAIRQTGPPGQLDVFTHAVWMLAGAEGPVPVDDGPAATVALRSVPDMPGLAVVEVELRAAG